MLCSSRIESIVLKESNKVIGELFSFAEGTDPESEVMDNYSPYNKIINTSADGLSDGVIGVYVTETASGISTVFEKHGLPGKPFGTFGDSDRLNPQVFRSDYALALYGVRNENNPNDTLIYWVDVICKLTDENDNIL